MNNDLSWLMLLLGLVVLFVFVIEIYVIFLMASFLASWFGFSGILWWVCAIIMFGIINGLIYSFWRL